MKTTLKATAIALAFVGATAISAHADEIIFNPGGVAYAYTDGYWTTKHEWRVWENPEHVKIYRAYPSARYYEYRHDRDPDMGWRGEVVITR